VTKRRLRTKEAIRQQEDRRKDNLFKKAYIRVLDVMRMST
jgi:hypothetical protein